MRSDRRHRARRRYRGRRPLLTSLTARQRRPDSSPRPLCELLHPEGSISRMRVSKYKKREKIKVQKSWVN